nr:MAG TPA: hypothetical protein [Caudoviricetes sp.]
MSGISIAFLILRPNRTSCHQPHKPNTTASYTNFRKHTKQFIFFQPHLYTKSSIPHPDTTGRTQCSFLQSGNSLLYFLHHFPNRINIRRIHFGNK